jgi:PAS domain S-box-containing protein
VSKSPGEAGSGVPKQPLDEEAPAGQLALKDRALAIAAEGITIADMRATGQPLIYVNSGFERLTGYSTAEVVGRNCRFLQGPESSPDAVQTIRDAIKGQRECVVEILNYRKDGSRFWNRLSITPVRDDAGNLTHYIGVQSDVTARRVAEEGLREATRKLERANLRMSRDLGAAARIQRSLLPAQLPPLPGLRATWTLRSCTELAGDTLDVFPLDDSRSALYVADVSGHGVPAALLSVTLSHTLSPRSRSDLSLSPAGAGSLPGLCGELNERFQMEEDRVQYFTMLYATFDAVSRTLSYVSAGHPPAILVPRRGQPRELACQSHPIGLLPDAEYEERELVLEPGDRVYVYSDGLVEALDPGQEEQFGAQRLSDVLAQAKGLDLEASVCSARASVERWCGDTEPDDDITLLGLEATG